MFRKLGVRIELSFPGYHPLPFEKASSKLNFGANILFAIINKLPVNFSTVKKIKSILCIVI
jgi:hypothetical protein